MQLICNSNAIKIIQNSQIIKEIQYDTTINNYGAITIIKGTDTVGLLLQSAEYAVFFEVGNPKPIFFGSSINSNLQQIESTIAATSFLTEGNIKYSPDNLNKFNLDLPWVEGVSGYGGFAYNNGKSISGEKLIFNKGDATGIIFFNGYISLKRPDL